MSAFGDGRPAPPVVSPESIELQRAAGRIAWAIKERLPGSYWLNVEADISPTLLRLVFHYREGSVLKTTEEHGTVEVDLIPGHPIDDPAWIASLIESILERMNAGHSDLIIPRPLDYFRHISESGATVFEEGKALELGRSVKTPRSGNPK